MFLGGILSYLVVLKKPGSCSFFQEVIRFFLHVDVFFYHLNIFNIFVTLILTDCVCFQVMSEVADMPSSLELNGLSSGHFVQSLNFGDLIGVSLGGVIYDKGGFAMLGNTCMAVLFITIIVQVRY